MTERKDDGTPDAPNRSSEEQHDGNAQRPGDHLDKERASSETIPRKSSLL